MGGELHACMHKTRSYLYRQHGDDLCVRRQISFCQSLWRAPCRHHSVQPILTAHPPTGPLLPSRCVGFTLAGRQRALERTTVAPLGVVRLGPFFTRVLLDLGQGLFATLEF